MHKSMRSQSPYSFYGGVICTHHQPSLLVRAWGRHKYHFGVPVAGFWDALKAELSFQISVMVEVRTSALGSVMAIRNERYLPLDYRAHPAFSSHTYIRASVFTDNEGDFQA